MFLISRAVLQRRIGANRFFFMSLTWWGLASLSFVYAKSYAGLLALRYVILPTYTTQAQY